MYKTTGDVMQGFSKEHTVPYLLQTGDLAMACAMSESVQPLLMSFGRVTTDPDQLAVMMSLQAGGCAEDRGREAELQSIAALRARNPEEAEDAIIRQKRYYALAAERYFKGWRHFKAYYGDPETEECPDFDEDLDEFIYLAGLLSGLQALNAEIQSTAPIGVPKNVGSVAARATSCLDNEKWWGAPMGLRATVWAMIPGAQPEGEDAFERLDASDALGEAAGVRISHVFHVIAAWNKGDMERVRAVIRRHAEAIEKRPPADGWVLVDQLATHNILAISDKLWMENTGHRTPMGGLGTFWDDEAPTGEVIDLDSLL
ncbi:hypothetical protein J057_08866 [Marinobacter nanhaiticus D15-8W]|uniref:Uncharacterized protein n=1 Tax=Marinobacter nanhaiticus D15-8W TaxID=626887 RepID=N6VYV7_9GAMM|nr:hypothetical protein J057_08866 [Marinobacter nanhaiticus D15-8W]